MYFEELGIEEPGTVSPAAAREAARGTLEQRLALYLQRFGENGQPTTGMPQTFIDNLDRVPSRTLTPSDDCPICACEFCEDEYPLVVALPCPGRHRFDLECVGPWLKDHSSCPMCRHDFAVKPKHYDLQSDIDDMFA